MHARLCLFKQRSCDVHNSAILRVTARRVESFCPVMVNEVDGCLMGKEGRTARDFFFRIGGEVCV